MLSRVTGNRKIEKESKALERVRVENKKDKQRERERERERENMLKKEEEVRRGLKNKSLTKTPPCDVIAVSIYHSLYPTICVFL
jgi:hypothetical protein